MAEVFSSSNIRNAVAIRIHPQKHGEGRRIVVCVHVGDHPAIIRVTDKLVLHLVAFPAGKSSAICASFPGSKAGMAYLGQRNAR